MEKADQLFMDRALQLAELGKGTTYPNPMVGAVLVYKNKIIGEGYHQKSGEAHAEVNCLERVAPENKSLIAQSTLYVTLEPCSHFGKTPPCSDLIIRTKIPRVVIGVKDPNPKVAGGGIERLKNAGVDVEVGVEKEKCLDLNKRFFTFQEEKRPYLILKWAQSPDGFIALPNCQPVSISNTYTNRMVHRWRSEEAAILVGTQTALSDNPRLTNRLWTGHSPLRLLIDKNNQIPADYHLLKDESPLLVFNVQKEHKAGEKEWVKIDKNKNLLKQIMGMLFERSIQSVLVEGGAKTIQHFIDQNLWDEARIITGERALKEGIPAPKLSPVERIKRERMEGDQIDYFEN